MPVKEQEFCFPRNGRRLVAWPGRAGLFMLLVMSRIPQAQQQYQDRVLSQMQNSGQAQTQIAPSLAGGAPQTLAEQANPGEFQVFGSSGLPPDQLDQPFQWGKIIFRPHITYRFLYGNGIQSAPGEQQKTVIQEFSPGMTVDLGPNWVLDYTPTLRYYSSRQFQDGLDQSVYLRGGTTYKSWVLGLSQSYTTTTSPTIETGTQVNQEDYVTALTAGCDLNDTLSLDLGLTQNFQFAEALQDSKEWSTMDWLNFKIFTRLNFGLGVGGGYDSLANGPDQTFEQYQARFNWRVNDKISVQANGGVENRQFRAANRSDLLNPLYGASIQYQPFDYTSIALNVSRADSQSLFQDEVTETTSFGVGVTQRLLGKLHLDLNGAYNMDNYVSSTAAIANRTDNFYSFNARLSCPMLKRGTVGLSYQYSHNQSTEAGFTYGSTQFGFDIGYTY